MTTPADLSAYLSRPDLKDRAKLVLLSLGLNGPATTAQLAVSVARGRRTVQLSLAELCRAGLVQARARGRQVWYAPVDNSGHSVPRVDNARISVRISQNDSQCAREFAQHGASSDAHTRTLRSSSFEEDVQDRPFRYPPPPGGAGGEATRPLAGPLERMRQWWAQLAPHGPAFPVAWVQRLVREFGLQIPLQVLRQYALSDRTLADLEHPERYKSYFLRCCYTQQDALAGKPEDQEAGREGKKEQEDMETAVDALVADVALLSARFGQEEQGQIVAGVGLEEAAVEEVLQTARSTVVSALAPRPAWGPAPSAPAAPDPGPARPPEPDLQGSLSSARPSTPGRTTAAALAPGRRPLSRPAPKGEPVEPFPIALGHYWPAIAPGCPLPAESLLLVLEQDYSRHLVLVVARHLLLTRRKLPDLEQPDQAWHAFVRACQEEAQTPTYSDPPPARPSRFVGAGQGVLRADARAGERAA